MKKTGEIREGEDVKEGRWEMGEGKVEWGDRGRENVRWMGWRGEEMGG